MNTFEELITHPGILKAITELGYTDPTVIQKKAIPEVLNGADLLASAQTGTGKTAAFLLPTLERLARTPLENGKGPRVLVLVPTRELALQVMEEAKKFSMYLPRMKSICIFGGEPYPKQNRELSRPYEILVATPGRLIDHVERGRIDFSRLETLILDEADRMLDMGFIHAVEEIAKHTPETRQTLLFSATLKGNVLKLSKRLLKNPIEVSAGGEKTKHENIEQKLYAVENIRHKHRLLNEFLKDPAFQQVIVFTSTKRQADELSDKLTEAGESVAVLHGDIKQRQRTKTVLRLRDGQVRVLVATDVAARGIDIPTISHVINFDLPMFVEDYVHRIGRTGRAGAKGTALSFATQREMSLVKQIERFTGHRIAKDGVEETNEPLDTSEPKEGYNTRDRAPRDRKPSQGRPFNKERSFSRDRAPRGESSFNKERPFNSDRAPRGDAPFKRERPFNSERAPRGESSFNKERPFNSERAPRGESSFNKERPFNSERAPRSDSSDSSFKRERSFNSDRAPRGDAPFKRERPFNSERAPRSESSFNSERAPKENSFFDRERPSGDRKFSSDAPSKEGRFSRGGPRRDTANKSFAPKRPKSR